MESSLMLQLAKAATRTIFQPSRKVRRWEVLAGACLMSGYRYGAELGVSTGRFSIFLLCHIPDLKMLCVDLWAEQAPRPHDGAETYAVAEGWDHDQSLAKFKSDCEQFFPGRVDIRRQHTVEAAKLIDDESLDFVFIDADHSYEGCIADIRAWSRKVKFGGLIAGHYFNEAWPGVMRAVNETGGAKLARDSVWLRVKA